MSDLHPRRLRVPNANNPQLLFRMLEHVAEGIRSTKALSELLGCSIGTIRAYAQAAEWLELAEAPDTFSDTDPAITLTYRGLDLAFGERRRARIYASAVWSQPFVISLMSGRGREMPPMDTLVREILRQNQGMSAATACRRASAVKGLLLPAIQFEQKSIPPHAGTQLSLGFPRPRRPVTQDRVEFSASDNELPEDPALYRTILQHLLDEGEISIVHLRAVLDRVGASAAPVGGYAEMALRRGDAYRWSDGIQDKLVITPGGIKRRDLSDTVASVALSDPDYREYLDVIRNTERGDPAAAIRYARLKHRFSHWDRRLFGADVRPRDIAHAVDRLLLGRPLDVFPVARPIAEIRRNPEELPFLEITDLQGVIAAFPPTIDVILGGVAALNRVLAERRRGPQRVGMPTALDPRVVVHGGLLHPGERLPRALADNVSLRLQAISRIPHLTYLAALLLLHRRSRGRLTLRVRGGKILVIHRRRDRGPLLLVLDRLLRHRGCLVSRRFRGGLETPTLLDICRAMRIASVVEGRLMLDEEFFLRMRTEPEDSEVFERLYAICNGIEGDLTALRGTPDAEGPEVDDEMDENEPDTESAEDADTAEGGLPG